MEADGIILESILDCFARFFQPQGRPDLLSDVLDIDAVGYDLIEFGLGVAVVVDGLKYFLAEMIHCFSVIEAFR